MALRYLLPGQMRFMASNGFDVLMISADGKELPEVIEREYYCAYDPEDNTLY